MSRRGVSSLSLAVSAEVAEVMSQHDVTFDELCDASGLGPTKLRNRLTRCWVEWDLQQVVDVAVALDVPPARLLLGTEVSA